MPERRILLVEDDEPLRSIEARHLRARGWVVSEATSAEEAALAPSRRAPVRRSSSSTSTCQGRPVGTSSAEAPSVAPRPHQSSS